MVQFFEGWRTLTARLEMGDLTALTQLVGYKLYAMFDEARFPENLPISDRELMRRTGIKSTRTIFEARRRLKNAGLIDFKVQKGKETVYRLCLAGETVGKQLVNSCQTPKENSYIRARAPNPCPPVSSSSSARARASEPTGVDELADFWTELQGGRLTFEHLSELERLIDRHGVDWVKAAMREASDANGNRYGLSFKLFRAVVNRRLKPKEVKANGYRYHAPTDDFDFAAD